MTKEAAITSLVSHLSLGTNDYPKAKAFYVQVLATLGVQCLMDFRGGAGYGRRFPEFWIQLPHDHGKASVGNGVHVCFAAQSAEQVQAFHAKALACGGTDDGAPGIRKEYSDGYDAAFVRDLDGNKFEAVAMVEG